MRDVTKEMCAPENMCSSDRECQGDLKCCVVASCGGPVCTAPTPARNYSLDHGLLQGPTSMLKNL